MYNFDVSTLKPKFEVCQPRLNSPLQGYFLVRTYTDDSPFTTVSDLPEAQAQKIMKANYGHIDDDNIAMRARVQKWLKEGADRANISRSRENPIYFAVVKDLESYKEQLPDGFKAIGYPLEQVDLDGFTFTMDDSFISAPVEVKGRAYLDDVADHDLHGRVLTAEDVVEYLGSGVSNYEQKGSVGHVHQFEAQLWVQAPKLINTMTCPMAQFAAAKFPVKP